MDRIVGKVAKIFLDLVKKHFPPSGKFRKLFNKNNVKVSYSCMPNILRVIKSHNSKILYDTQVTTPRCNCKGDERRKNCPLPGCCTIENIVYSAEVSTGPEDGNKVYLGASEPSFKRRHANHNTSFKHSSHRKATSLSAYVWDCKESGKNNFQFQWSVVKQTHGYNRVSKTCDLCLNEKLEILNFKDRDKLLNKRSELISKCRHFNKYLLKNMK